MKNHPPRVCFTSGEDLCECGRDRKYVLICHSTFCRYCLDELVNRTPRDCVFINTCTQEVFAEKGGAGWDCCPCANFTREKEKENGN